MLELLEYGDFPKSTLRIGFVLECLEYLFEGIDFFGLILRRDLPDMTIGSRAYFFDYFVFVENVLINLFVFSHQRIRMIDKIRDCSFIIAITSIRYQSIGVLLMLRHASFPSRFPVAATATATLLCLFGGLKSLLDCQLLN